MWVREHERGSAHAQPLGEAVNVHVTTICHQSLCHLHWIEGRTHAMLKTRQQ